MQTQIMQKVSLAHNVSFWSQHYFQEFWPIEKEEEKVLKCFGLSKMRQFLGPETEIMGKRNYIR